MMTTKMLTTKMLATKMLAKMMMMLVKMPVKMLVVIMSKFAAPSVNYIIGLLTMESGLYPKLGEDQVPNVCFTCITSVMKNDQRPTCIVFQSGRTNLI
jgi:hypothetical protein